MKKILFVIGGEKSGKSSYALKEGEKILGRKAFIATALPIDEEMEERIKRHKAERGSSWVTFEEPLKIADVVEDVGKDFDLILVDCLTIWVSNLLYYNKNIDFESERLIKALSKKETDFIIVSNEVGLGIVPESIMGRKFRTILGTLNQVVASLADRVVFMISGIPVQIKNL